MNILNHISESLKQCFGLEHLNSDADGDPDPGIFLTLDPGSEMEKIRIREPE